MRLHSTAVRLERRIGPLPLPFERIFTPAHGATPAALAFALLTLALPPAAAQLRLAPVIGDGMVMQRHATVPVWGWADRQDTVVVTFDRRTYTTVADTSGQWVIKLPPRAAGGPYELTVTARRERLQVRNILMGDVWFCAGQSNMALPVTESQNATQEIVAAHDLRIRQFKVPSYRDQEAGRPITPAWTVADSAHVGSFTAVGYYFARALRKSVDVPIGLINVAVGGSAIAQWMSDDALRLVKAGDLTTSYAPGYLVGRRTPTQLYNQMVHPLLRYPIKGVLWYQGEIEAGYSGVSSSTIDIKYRELFPAMIDDWRRAWGLGDFPFLFVQLPNYGEVDTMPARNSSLATLRESQSAVLRLSNTAQAVAIDLGDGSLHPPNKQDVGARLALAARHVAYGEQVEASGPLYRRHTVQGGRVVVEFDHVGQGLAVGRNKDKLQGFAIAGADRQFVWANAKIERDRVVVWSERVPQPTAVRYAWANNPNRANLYNGNGLPAAPFRTDEWPRERSSD